MWKDFISKLEFDPNMQLKDFLWYLGEKLPDYPHSILKICAEKKVPIYCPAFTDSGLAMQISFNSKISWTCARRKKVQAECWRYHRHRQAHRVISDKLCCMWSFCCFFKFSLYLSQLSPLLRPSLWNAEKRKERKILFVTFCLQNAMNESLIYR